MGVLLPAFRLSLTGLGMGPSLFNIAELIGKKETLSRIDIAIKDKKMMTIAVEGIKLYAYHGHLKEEAVLGGHFCVSVWIDVNTEIVEETDNLTDTLDYVRVINIVKEQMLIRSNMIETPTT